MVAYRHSREGDQGNDNCANSSFGNKGYDNTQYCQCYHVSYSTHKEINRRARLVDFFPYAII